MRSARQLAKGRKRLRSNIHIASINMRGGGSPATFGKWKIIHQTMKRRRIGIMAVQETHLKDSDLQRLNNTHKKTIHIINSNPTDRSNANGVAIILSKNLTAWAEHEKWVLHPGRALMVRIPWKKAGGSKVVLAVYAPNAPDENAKFWANLKKKWTDAPSNSPLPMPDIMLGDFNVVEDSADRLPTHTDSTPAVEALRDLKKFLRLIDGWRTENPDELAYTYTQVTPTPAQSRIDRIYTTHKIFQTSRDWEMYQSAFLTDHKFVTFHYFDPGVQVHGNGRWTVPHYITKDEKFISTARKIVSDTMEAIKEKQPGPGVYQGEYDDMKEAIRVWASVRIKQITPKVKMRILSREAELEKVINNKALSEGERLEKAAEIEEDIKSMQIHHHSSVNNRIELKYGTEREKVGKTWVRSSREAPTRDPIMALKKPEDANGALEYNSKKMAQMAAEYHESLQESDLFEFTSSDEEDRAMEEVLQSISKHLRTEQTERLGDQLSRDEIYTAVMGVPNDKAPGLDGVPVEVWKALTDSPKSGNWKKENDLTALLTLVFDEMETHGISETYGFAMGW
ncbi:Endonuclease/exonuclease/phosphatase, partial [Ephemerocybe angulata]